MINKACFNQMNDVSLFCFGVSGVCALFAVAIDGIIGITILK